MPKRCVRCSESRARSCRALPRAGSRLLLEAHPHAGARAQIEEELSRLERAVAPRPPAWAWVLVGIGLLAILGLGIHAYTAYTTIYRINQDAKLDTGNPVVLFQDLATNGAGARVSAAVPSSSRSTYTRALNQYILDGTGVCLGIVLAFAGLFIRLNR